jgi:hypothetical protein
MRKLALVAVAVLLSTSSDAQQQPAERTYQLSFTASQVDTIYKSLAERPWKEVNSVIVTLSGQVSAAEQKRNEPEKKPDEAKPE